jgi:hypothetical protein
MSTRATPAFSNAFSPTNNEKSQHESVGQV